MKESFSKKVDRQNMKAITIAVCVAFVLFLIVFWALFLPFVEILDAIIRR